MKWNTLTQTNRKSWKTSKVQEVWQRLFNYYYSLLLALCIDFQNRFHPQPHSFCLSSNTLYTSALMKHTHTRTHSPRRWFAAAWGQVPPRWVQSRFGRVFRADCSSPSGRGTACAGTRHHDNLERKRRIKGRRRGTAPVREKGWDKGKYVREQRREIKNNR